MYNLEWVFVPDVRNQYVFHYIDGDKTHQLEFEIRPLDKFWIRKMKIMKIMDYGDITYYYSLFEKEKYESIECEEKTIDIKKARHIFGDIVINKILSFI